VVKVDQSVNLALLKLEKDKLPTLAFARSPRQIPFATLGQLMEDASAVGGRWPTVMHNYSVQVKDERTSYVSTDWQGTNAFITEFSGQRWLFLKDVKPEDKTRGGGPVMVDGDGLVGVYISRFVIEGGGKSDELRLCVPLTETVKFLESAGLSVETLRNPFRLDGSRAEKAEDSFQVAWRALSNVIGANWGNAVTDAKTLTELRPESSQVWLLYGVALAGSGKAEESIKAYDTAIKLDSGLPNAYLNRGIAYGVLEKGKEAEEDFRKAIQLDTGDINGHMWLSRLLSADETRRDDAVKSAEQAVSLSPNSPMARLNLASTLAIKGDRERAGVELQRALEIAPAFQDARAALAANYRELGRMNDAEREYRTLVRAEPNNPIALLELAAFLVGQDQSEEANLLVSQVLEMDLPEPLKEAARELSKKTE
jgi:tetratricopeptide (TPR) repeat protein